MVYESRQQHGWNEDYSLEWVNKIFLTKVTKHLGKREVECDYDTDCSIKFEHSDISFRGLIISSK